MSVGDHFQSPLRGATRPTPRPYSVPLLASYLPPTPQSLAVLRSPGASALLPPAGQHAPVSQGLCVRGSSCFRSSSRAQSLGFSHFIQA